jgi:hypothetical protein
VDVICRRDFYISEFWRFANLASSGYCSGRLLVYERRKAGIGISSPEYIRELLAGIFHE